MTAAVKHTHLINRPCKRQVQSSPAEGTKLLTHLHSAATHNSRPAAGSHWTPPLDPFTDPTAGTQGPHYLTPWLDSSRPAAGTHRTPPPDPFTHQPHAQYTACCRHSPNPPTWPLHSNATRTVHSMLLVLIGPHHRTPSLKNHTHSTRHATGTHQTPPPDPFTQKPHAQYTACYWHSPDPTTGPLHSKTTRTVHGMLLALTRPHHRTPSLTLLLALTGPHHLTPSLDSCWHSPDPTTWPLHSPCCWHSPDPTTWPLHSPCCWHSPDPTTWPLHSPCCWHSPDPTSWPLHSPCCCHSPDPTTWPLHSPAAGTHRTPPPDPFTHPLLALTGPHHLTPSLTLLLSLTGPHHLTPSLTRCWHSPDPFTHPAAGTRGLQQNPATAEQGANGESACWRWQLPLPTFNNRFTGGPIDDDLGADVNVYTVHFVTRLFGSIPRSISPPPYHERHKDLRWSQSLTLTKQEARNGPMILPLSIRRWWI